MGRLQRLARDRQVRGLRGSIQNLKLADGIGLLLGALRVKALKRDRANRDARE
jgi:hypothetical protein